MIKEAIGYGDTIEQAKEDAVLKLNAKAENTIMIGDTPIDFESAKKAGIEKTILVATGQMSKNELSKFSPFHVNTLLEVLF